MNPQSDPAEYALWHRKSRRHKWRVIGTAATSAAAYALMNTAGHKGGNWIVTALPADPNVRTSPHAVA